MQNGNIMSRRIIFYCLTLLLPLPALSSTYGGILIDEVTSIYDADTFRVNIKDWPAIIGRHVPIRVRGMDAPEIRGRCPAEKAAAQRAREETVNLLRNAGSIELRQLQRGKYFRILAEVYIDGQNLAETLISKKLARPYAGGKRQSWCD